ncbi:MAG: hypothetical protein ACE5JM_05680 [Armatimonadota bacterium]
MRDPLRIGRTVVSSSATLLAGWRAAETVLLSLACTLSMMSLPAASGESGPAREEEAGIARWKLGRLRRAGPSVVSAVVEGSFCWDVPEGGRPGDPDWYSVGWESPFVVVGVAKWLGGAVEWRGHSAVQDVGGGVGRQLPRGGFDLRGTVLTKPGQWWAYFARRGSAELETDLAELPAAFEGPFQPGWTLFERYAAGSVYAREPDHLSLTYLRAGTLEGVSCELYAVSPREPVKVEEPHAAHEYRVWIDPVREVQVRADGLDAEGRVVRSVGCSDFVRLATGRWVPLTVATHVEPGTSRGVRRWRTRGGGRGEPWQADEDLEFDVEFPGYRQVARYEILPGDLVLPRTVTRYNESGDVIMQLRFVEYDLGDLP